MGDEKSSSSTKSSPNNDPTSPYYIHPSDLPRQMHVNDELNDENYGIWVQEMENFLYAKNKIGFVDGSMEEPEEPIELAAWKRCDAMVKGWLTMAMEKNIRYSVRYAKTTAVIWSDLKERFVKESAPRAYELKRTLTMTRQENLSVSEYYTKLRRLWDEIDEITPISCCSCGGSKKLMEVKEYERLYEFLMGLNESFNTVRTQILTTKPIMTINAAYHLVAEDEQNKSITTLHKPIMEATTFQTTRKTQKSTGSKCSKCGRIGHSIDSCFEIIGYPDWWLERQATREKGTRGAETRGQNAGSSHVRGLGESGRGNQTHNSNNVGRENRQGERGRQPRVALAELGLSDNQYTKLLSLLTPENEGPSNDFVTANMAGKSIFHKPWIIDSGATEYISFDKSLLHNFRPNENNIPVRIPNGDFVPVQGVGSILSKNGMELKNVLYIPDFECNLLSVSRLTKDLNCTLTFSSGLCTIQDSRSMNLIGAGKSCDGLYCSEPVGDCGTALSTHADPMIWHKRLGHASDIKLKQLNFLDKNFDCNKFYCDSCLRAKQTRLPFGDSYIKSNTCFELIHCDIWGCYKIASLTGAQYFLSIVDDYSRAVCLGILDGTKAFYLLLGLLQDCFKKKHFICKYFQSTNNAYQTK